MATYGEQSLIIAQHELIGAQARGRSASAEALSMTESSLRDAKSKLAEAEDEAEEYEKRYKNERRNTQKLEEEKQQLLISSQQQSKQWAEAVAERDAIILEWMVSHEAYKRLAKEYGKKLDITEEQRLKDISEHILAVVEEDPQYEKTERYETAKQRLGKQNTLSK